MRGYKHIKFSRHTAKINPEMIIDAYNKLINSIEQDITNLHIKQDKIEISVITEFLYRSARLSAVELIEQYNKDISITLNPNEVIDLYNKVQDKYRKELVLQKLAETVREELSNFKNRFL